MRFILFFIILFVFSECKQAPKRESEEIILEIDGLMVNRDSVLKLASGIQIKIIDTGYWVCNLVKQQDQFYSLLDIPYNLHGMSFAKNDNHHPVIRNISGKSMFSDKGLKPALCATPWNTIMWVTEDQKGGQILRENNNSVLSEFPLDVSGNIVSIHAVMSKSGNNIIYLISNTEEASFLYKLVEEKSSDNGHYISYIYDLKSSNWQLVSDGNAVKGFGEVLGDICEGSVHGNLFISALPRIQNFAMHGLIFELSEAGEPDVSTFATCKPYLINGENNLLSHAHHLNYSGGHLWLTTSIPSKPNAMNEYSNFGNNALIVIPGRGIQEGIPVRIATAPANGVFVGIVADENKNSLYSWLLEPGGKSVLIEFQGETLEKIFSSK